MAETVCVTGCCGYIASHIVKILLEKGYTVHGTMRPSEDSKYIEKLAEALTGNLKLFEADLTKPESFKAPIAGCSLVFQCAAHVGGWTKDPFKEVIDLNCKASVDVLAVAHQAGVRRVVYTSSTFATHDPWAPSPPVNGSLYTEADWNLNTGEETAWSKGKWDGNAWAAYGVGKTLGERKAWEYAKANDVDLVVINPGVVIGPAVGNGGATVNIFTGNVKNNTPIMNAVFHVVDVRDVARAHVAAAENPNANGRYLCMHSWTTGHREFAQATKEAFPDMVGIDGLDAESAAKPGVDNSKTRKLLGGNLISLKTTVADTVRMQLALGKISMSK